MRSELIQAYYDSPEYLSKLRARADLIKMLDVDPLQRARVMYDIWAVNPERFIEDVLWVKIPEFASAIKPFFIFDYQRDIIREFQEAEASGKDITLLIDKPRGMGLTWIIAAYMYWRWLFTPNWSGFILSRTETEVDDGTDLPDNSIFGKIRFLIKYSPDWIIPEGFAPKGKKGTSTDSSLRIINPAMGTAIVGSSTNSNAGRSRRYSFIFVDECFFIERFNEVWRSLQSVARVQVLVSTVKQGRMFEDFRKLIDKIGKYISLSWKDHPFKDQIWYDEQIIKAEFDPEVMKEVEVDYSVSMRNQYYPEIRQAKVEPIEYDRQKPLYVFLDIGRQDKTVIGWMQFDGSRIKILDTYSNSYKPLDWYAPFMNPELSLDPNFTYNEFQLEMINKIRSWKKPVGWFGEQAHFNRIMPLNKSNADILKSFKISLRYNRHAVSYEPRRKAVSLLLPRMVFNQSAPGALELYDAVATSRYPANTRGASKESGMKPVHDDVIADYRAALENGCTCISLVIRHQREDVSEDIHKEGVVRSLIKYLKM